MATFEGVGQTPAPLTTAETLHGAYHAGLDVHQMAPLAGITLHLANAYDIYTSTEPRDPGTFREYHQQQRLERTMDALADATEERFRGVEEFAESFEDGTFPLVLARTFDSIINIRGKNVHLKNERTVDGREDGDIFIEETIFEVEPNSTRLLNTVFNKLLHKDNIQREDVHQPIVYPDEGGDGRPPTISIVDASEHDIRAMERAVESLLWRYFRNQGIQLPNAKSSFATWSDWGETFPYPSEAVGFMRNVAGKYLEVQTEATYDPAYAEHDLRPVARVRGPLGTDGSGVFQRWRNVVNGLGHHIRGGSSARNLEQNPNRFDRLSLEETAGVELRRDIITDEQAEYGPGSPRMLSSLELAAEAVRRKIEEAKQDKFGAAVKTVKAAISLGVIDLGLTLLAKLPTGLRMTSEISEDAATYRQRQKELKASREVLKHVVWHEVMSPRLRELDAEKASGEQPPA